MSMRVLFVTCAEHTAFAACVPLASALRSAGHEVRVAGQPGFTATIERAGLTAVPLGRDRDIWRAFGVAPGEYAALHTALLEPYDLVESPDEHVTWDYLRAGYERQVTWWHKMANVPMIGDLVGFARHWRPDLIIWEPTTYAGSVAARATGVAHARLLWGLDIVGATRTRYRELNRRRPPDDRPDPLADWLAGYARRYDTGYAEDMVTGQVTIDPLPPSLRLDTGLPHLPMRYQPCPEPEPECRAPAERPRVAVVLDTAHPGDHPLTPVQVRTALAGLDVEPVPAAPPAFPPGCAAVIHHADARTVCTALRDGIPQLALRRYFDEPPLAGAVARQGAGLELHPSRADAQAIRDALHRVLTEPAFAGNAARLREETLALPTPADLIPQLEALAADHATAFH